MSSKTVTVTFAVHGTIADIAQALHFMNGHWFDVHQQDQNSLAASSMGIIGENPAFQIRATACTTQAGSIQIEADVFSEMDFSRRVMVQHIEQHLNEYIADPARVCGRRMDELSTFFALSESEQEMLRRGLGAMTEIATKSPQKVAAALSSAKRSLTRLVLVEALGRSNNLTELQGAFCGSADPIVRCRAWHWLAKSEVRKLLLPIPQSSNIETVEFLSPMEGGLGKLLRSMLSLGIPFILLILFGSMLAVCSGGRVANLSILTFIRYGYHVYLGCIVVLLVGLLLARWVAGRVMATLCDVAPDDVIARVATETTVHVFQWSQQQDGVRSVGIREVVQQPRDQTNAGGILVVRSLRPRRYVPSLMAVRIENQIDQIDSSSSSANRSAISPMPRGVRRVPRRPRRRPAVSPRSVAAAEDGPIASRSTVSTSDDTGVEL